MNLKKVALTLYVLGALCFAGFVAVSSSRSLERKDNIYQEGITDKTFPLESDVEKNKDKVISEIPIKDLEKDILSETAPNESNAHEEEKDESNITLPEDNNTLRLGDKGESVKLLQEKLNSFGYFLTVDGIFGKDTESALYDFQVRNNIKANKIADSITFQKLELTPTEETMFTPPDSNLPEKFINSKNASSGTDYYIWVDTENTKVYIFQGHNRNWTLIKDMLCTVGTPSTPTIKGTYKVGIKGDYFVVRGNPNLRCDFYTQISGNYLFHTVLLNRNSGKIVDGRLGQKLSHGCIRLAIENAKYIFDNIPTGTTIYIT